jgi:hypothetical protein
VRSNTEMNEAISLFIIHQSMLRKPQFFEHPQLRIVIHNDRARPQIAPNNNHKYYISIILIVTHFISLLMSFKCKN